MTVDDLSFDLASLHAAYASGVRPVEVIAEVYRRIGQASDPGIFISLVDEAKALATAEALGDFDAKLPLFGVPVAVKDNIDVAGLPTTAACPDFAYRPEESATAVARLVAAGAIVVGKTNLDQFATGLVGVRTPYPVPRNAIDPDLVPGGSSSGSAVAVARGIVSIALGTDTAGSGRVPAGLNRIVGLKPSLGAVSTRGVVPACRTLDCVSVFALTVDDAHAAFAVMAGFDAEDPYARRVPIGPVCAPPKLKIGVPTPESLRFFGDGAAEAAFQASVADLAALGYETVPVDLEPFYAVADMLYEGAWVAERYAAVGDFLAAHAERVHPVTRKIIGGATKLTAVDAFRGLYKLASLRRAVEPALASFDMMVVPTYPYPVTLAEIASDPIGANSRLGTYTNFVNLLDLSAIAVPGSDRSDGRASSVTLVGPSGADGLLAAVGRRLHGRAGGTMGGTGRPIAVAPEAARTADGLIAVAVVGAHLSGMPLNPVVTGLGGVFVRADRTAADYTFHALAGGPPARPGLIRVAPGTGAEIELEIWALPPEGFGKFVATIPPPLGIGTVRLSGGGTVHGFICEGAGVEGAIDITGFGGWRAYLAAKSAA